MWHIKSTIKPIFAHAIDFIRRHPTFKESVVAWMKKCPPLEARLRRFAARGAYEFQRKTVAYYELLRIPPAITPEALTIYDKLNLAIKKRNGEIG